MLHLTKCALLGLLPLIAPPRPSSPTGESTAFHDFHISKCLLEYNEREQAVQISLHLFIDDLEEALRRHGAGKLFLCTSKEAPDAEQYLERYLKQRFIIRLNGQERSYTFIGKEISEDLLAAWCYLEITNVPSLKQLSVTNTLLMDLFDDQKNVVSVSGPGKKQGLLLFQKGRDTEEVGF